MFVLFSPHSSQASERAFDKVPPPCDDRLASIPLPTVQVGEYQSHSGYRTAPLRFPSPIPSRILANDIVRGDLYLPDANGTGEGPRPAVVVLHNLLAIGNARFEREMAAHLARSGFVVAFMDLPYHRRRSPTGVSNGALFIRSDLARTALNVEQAAADASALVRWLSERSDVDPKRLGMVGVSMGGFITHLVMGQNSRVKAGVTFVAGGDVAGLIWQSNAGVARAVQRRLESRGISREEAARQLREVEPTTYARCIAPRPVLMVNATDDLIVPRSSAEAMARALGDPPQLWLSTNHFGIALLPGRLYRLTEDFLGAELNGRRFPRTKLRQYAIPAVKAGIYTGLKSRLTAGVGVEYPVLYTRRNRPALAVEGLWTGRGVFAGVAHPLTEFLDAGVAWRVFQGNRRVSAYLAWTIGL